jgi:hypothetical protein
LCKATGFRQKLTFTVLRAFPEILASAFTEIFKTQQIQSDFSDSQKQHDFESLPTPGFGWHGAIFLDYICLSR